ncbi:acetyltransferase (GNAT) family protein [Hoeflea halophila]|uniref:Acetyltransferase (GNAT) family protein n=1 Tax=Hoeflea halophila TaxID=714899 RepID=A0A286I8X0_9HYPH|nr:N-acetyltransferase [Hoeflea halophila]SOE16512.1 acetyltransferase (GNAT) family protein [Hoeflea halophila]
MSDISIRPAVPGDVEAVNRALSQLSADMGDAHKASDADIARACFGPAPVLHALVASGVDGKINGVAAYSPFFSTVYGSVGIYVSDLWVDEKIRGQRLGQRLLAAVHRAGHEAWEASFIRLGVYHANSRARAFYERIGFVAAEDTEFMTLAGDALRSLGEKA